MPVTNDNSNAGRRQVAEIRFGLGLDNTTAEPLGDAAKLRLLKNGIVDRRKGSIHKRPGSVTELEVANKRPLGMTEHFFTGTAVGDLNIPVSRYLFSVFSDKTFIYFDGSAWQTISLPAAKSGRIDMSSSRPIAMAGQQHTTAIAGGRPLIWHGPGSGMPYTSFDDAPDVIGIPRPVVQSKLISTSAGATLTVGVGYRYMITFEREIRVNGVVQTIESDWDTEASDGYTVGYWDVAPGSYASISVTINNLPTDAEKIPFNWIRLYRTLDGGNQFYYTGYRISSDVLGASSGSITFIDSTLDSALTVPAANAYEKLPPLYDITKDWPIVGLYDKNERYARGYGTSYICAAYAQAFWFVDATNPHKLVFSSPYTGDLASFHYYPIDNYVYTTEPITGLFATPGRLLVFHPRSISYISGSSIADFELRKWAPGSGTLFHNSIASNGSEITWLDEQGIVAAPVAGGAATLVSREIDETLQPLLRGTQQNEAHISTVWNPSLRQFIYMFHVSRLGGVWEDVDTGDTSDPVAGWEDTTTFDTEEWERVGGTPADATLDAARNVRIWGWNPGLSDQSGQLWTEYTFAKFPNLNDDGAFPAFMYHPGPDNTSGEIQQSRTYILYYRPSTVTPGINSSFILRAFDRSLGTDDALAFTTEIISGRIVPDPSGAELYFEGIGFDNFYTDPTRNTDGTADNTCTLYVLRDIDDAGLRDYTTFREALLTSNRNIKGLTRGRAKWINLHLTSTSTTPELSLLTNCYVHYRARHRRGTR